MRRALLIGLAALAVAAPAAQAEDGTTAVSGVSRLGPHDVRVLVKAPGDLPPAAIDAKLGAAPAFVAGVHRTGPRQPLDLVFAVDTSGSMAGTPIAGAIAAGERLLDAVGHGDRVGLVSFASGAAVVAPLTTNVQTVRDALENLQTGQGTALYDGIALATKAVGERAGARRVVVVLSDGRDTASRSSLAAAKRLVAARGVELDAVGLTSSTSFTATPLVDVSSPSGGRFVSTASAHGLEPIVAGLAQARLSTTYAVDVSLPDSASRKLSLSVRGERPFSVSLPAGVSGTTPSAWLRHGGLLIALLAFATVAFAFLSGALRLRRPATLASRLSPYSAVPRERSRKQRAAVLTDAYETLEQRFAERWAWRALERLAEQAGVTSPTAQVVVVVAASALVLGLAGGFVLGLRGLAVGLLLGAGLPLAVLRVRATRRQQKFDEQLPELLGVMSSALRAGRSFAQALDALVDEASEPALSEFRRAQNQVRVGVPIEQALDDMSKRLRSESFELVVLTTDVQRRIGGNVAEIFDQVAETTRKRHQFAARVKALVAMGQMSARVLLALPFGMAVLLTVVDHGYERPLYATHIGHVLVCVALVMMALGGIVLNRMVKPRAIA